MAKLADVTAEIRVILKLLAASAIIVTVIFVFFKGGQIFKNAFFPTPPPPPAEKFGKLPRIEFPPNESSNLTYQINTVTGELPTTGNLRGQIPDRVKVYKIKRKEPSLTALQTARENVSFLGFINNETKINESVYQWSNTEGDAIQYNILTDNFRILSNFLTQPPGTLSPDFGNKNTVLTETKNILENLGEDISDIDEGRSDVSYFAVGDGKLIKVDSRSNAQVVELNLMQKKIDNLPIYYPRLDRSTMYFVYKSIDTETKVVEARFTHFLANTKEVTDYPIKTALEAFEDLKRGDALIINNTYDITIDITDVSLGYYAGEENQPYFLPVIVFGGKDFVAYVQAVPETSIGN